MSVGTTDKVVGVPEAPAAESRVYRCEYCKQVVLYAHIVQFGGCKKCGSRKVRLAFEITDQEIAAAKDEGYVFNDDEWSDDIEHAYND